MVTMTSTSASADDAVRTVQAAIDLYIQQLAQRTDQQIAPSCRHLPSGSRLPLATTRACSKSGS